MLRAATCVNLRLSTSKSNRFLSSAFSRVCRFGTLSLLDSECAMSGTTIASALRLSGSSKAPINGCYGLANVTAGVAEYWKVTERKTRKKKLPDEVYRIRAVDKFGQMLAEDMGVDDENMRALADAWVVFRYAEDCGSEFYYAAAKTEDCSAQPPTSGWIAVPSAPKKAKKSKSKSKPKPKVECKSDESAVDDTITLEPYDIDEVAKQFEAVNEQVTKAKATVGFLKDTMKGSPALKHAVDDLKKQMQQESELRYAAKCAEIAGKKYRFAVRSDLKEVSDAGFIYTASAEIHGGCAGLYDFGPTGAALKANIVNEWKSHFIIAEDMLEIESTMLTPAPVLKTSGHVAKFADLMIKDLGTGTCHRADKLLEAHIEELLEKDGLTMSDTEKQKHKSVYAQADAYSAEELGALMRSYGIVSPETGNAWEGPFAFNLMFATQIGATGKQTGYLRPETAQGIFTNFHKLLAFNNGEMPFAAAQIGHSFRNEIAPRGGLLRVREFQMAEIEHFCTDDVATLRHPKFGDLASLQMRFLARDRQTAGVTLPEIMSIEEAVFGRKIVSQSTLGYYMARTQLFLAAIGVDPTRLRFRQHLATEMAHYAKDCWDAEIHTSYGWVECVGHADRACFDLSQHASATGVKLEATKVFAEPKTVATVHKKVNKRAIAKTYTKKAGVLIEYLSTLSDADARALDAQLEEAGASGISLRMCDGSDYRVLRELFAIKEVTKRVHSQTYVPPVVEPSFGIGRILYALLEHSLYTRAEDAQRKVLKLRPRMAPVKVMVYPLSSHSEEMLALCTAIHRTLKSKHRIVSRIDASTASPGRRYSRADQLGTPFHVTVDFQSLKDNSVTVRERDTTRPQIRVAIDELPSLLADLCAEKTHWKQVLGEGKYPIHSEQLLD